MSFASREWLAFLLFVVVSTAQARDLRVCADPNNLPFSNAKEEGLENQIVHIVANELHADVRYTWWAQRRGYIRNTLKAGLCDLVPGVASGVRTLKTTAPYYRSSYVFVTRKDDAAISSFDDPALRQKKVGVQLIGDDGYNSPPAHALAQRGVIANVRGFPVYGDYAQPDPAAPIVRAVATGDIDVAIVWGPLAGYFATRQSRPLTIVPVRMEAIPDILPMAFDISMGVRKGDMELLKEIDDALRSRRAEIQAVLAKFNVPRVDPPPD